MDENNIAFRRSTSRLSMLDKSLERRRVNKEHNSNFRAGYVAVHEDHLHKTGLRGRKRFVAYFLLFIIFLVALANLALTVLIVLALQIDQNGSDVLSYQSDGGIRFKTEVTADKVLLDTGEFGGYRAQDLEISGDGQPVSLHHMGGHGASVEMDGGDIIMRAQDGLKVINPKTGNAILHTANDSGITSPLGIKHLSTSHIITSKISPSVGDELTIEADETMTVQGNEGLAINGREIEFISGADITFTSVNTMTLEVGSSGSLYLNTTLLPKRGTAQRPPGSTKGYALCVCPDTGAVFRVVSKKRLPHPCGNLNPNPCTG